jgi:hypothetical protein
MDKIVHTGKDHSPHRTRSSFVNVYFGNGVSTSDMPHVLLNLCSDLPPASTHGPPLFLHILTNSSVYCFTRIMTGVGTFESQIVLGM